MGVEPLQACILLLVMVPNLSERDLLHRVGLTDSGRVDRLFLASRCVVAAAGVMQ
jgi:hypothetical protein